MCASPLNFLRAGPPPPKVAFLSDALFFARSVPIAASASAVEAAAQAEVALEGLAPFPLAQLYYGTFWVPGAENALVFAAYRRRFSAEQAAEWGEAELVLPGFAAVLGAEVAPGTAVVLTSPDNLTVVQWDKSPVPVRVVSRLLAPEETEEERARARQALLDSLGGTGRVVEVAAPLTAAPAENDGALVFRAGTFVSRLAASAAAQLDVRDKAELSVLREARRRDVFLWRVAIGAVAALLLLAVGELAIVGAGKFWQQPRQAKVAAQNVRVDEIKKAHEFANRIEALSTKRLLPFEMIALLIEDNRKPPEISFVAVSASSQPSIYTLTIDAATTNMGQLSAYANTLRRLPMIQSVETRDEKTRNDGGTFRLIVTFKPDTLKPATSIAK